MVTVKLFGHIAALAGKDRYATRPATVETLLRELIAGLPPAERRYVVDPDTGRPAGLHLALNEEGLTLPAALDRELSPGDTLIVVSPLSGG